MKLKQKSLLSLAVISALTVLNANANNTKDNVNLNEVTVTSAAGYEQKLIDAPASISIISLEDLQKKPYTNLLDAVRDIEGVDIGETRDKSGQGSISIRGMGGDYTMILIDGKKQNNNGDIYPNNFGGYQSANIPPLSMVERIEIIRGPMSTLYGSDAMGGVVNIITKKISDEWTGSFSHGKTFQTDSQFGNDTTTDFALMGPLIDNKLGLSLRGSYYDKEASTPDDSDGSFSGAGKTMDNQNWSGGAGLTFTPNDNNTIRFDYDMMKQKYDNTGSYAGTVDSYDTIFERQRVGYAPIQRMEREQYSLSWEADWDLGKSTIGMHHVETNNFGRSLPLNATQRTFIANNIDGNGEDWQTVDDAMNNADFVALMPRGIRTLKSENTTYDAKFEMPFDNHFVVVGAQYVKAEVEDGVFGMTADATTSTGVVSAYDQWALFAEDNWSFADNYTLTTGVRYDDHETFGDHLSPRAYLVATPITDWTFKGGVSTGYKTPKTTDLFDGITGFGGQGTSPWVGNPDLDPEESLNTEVAAYYSHPNGHNINVTLFKNDFKDKIESVTVAQDMLPVEWNGIKTSNRQMQNVGDAEIKGIEIAGKYQIIDSLAVKGNYTFTDSEVESTGDPLGSSAKHLYNVTLDWQTTDRWNNYLKFSGEKDRWRGDDDLDYYEDYQVFDLGTSYMINENVTFNGRINNLLDKDFTEIVKYTDSVGVEQETEAYNLAQKRREIWLSVNVTF